MILGVTGFKGSGKDTFAQPFIESGFLQLRFADPLKAMLRAMLLDAGLEPSLIHEMLEGNSKEIPFSVLGDKTPRFAMQTLGTEWRNLLDKELWTRIMLKKLVKLEATSSYGTSVIITDVRFPHEVSALKAVGGKLIKIYRTSCVADYHESEQHIGQLPADVEIHNNHGIDWLHAEARRTLTSLAAQF